MVETGCSVGLCSSEAALKGYPSLPWAQSGRQQSLKRAALLAQHCTAAEGETGTPALKQDPNAAGKTCPKTHELAWLFSEGKVISRICSSPEKLLSLIKHW